MHGSRDAGPARWRCIHSATCAGSPDASQAVPWALWQRRRIHRVLQAPCCASPGIPRAMAMNQDWCSQSNYSRYLREQRRVVEDALARHLDVFWIQLDQDGVAVMTVGDK